MTTQISTQLIPFGGNCTTSVVRQGKYRIVHHKDGFAIEIIVETPDSIRSFPTSREHPELIEMVNRVKVAADGREGGQFYINEWHQVIVPAGNPVQYYYAGEYPHPVVLILNGTEFSGRPHDDAGNLLQPGAPWVGRPRPGIGYTLKAGGVDIEYTVELGPGRERVVRLSKEAGAAAARLTARKIAQVKRNTGGRFYINEYRAFFGPQQDEDGYHYVFIGMLTDQDAWFPKWSPDGEGKPLQDPPRVPPAAQATPTPPPTEAQFQPAEKKLEIADGDTGHSMESLFAAYMRGATSVTVKDSYLVKPHQVANFLRFCELLVRLGSIKLIKLVTKELNDESFGRLETVKRSLASYGIDSSYTTSPTLHDREILTDTGWEISLGRGLDIYKRPNDWLSVGATDFALRPCYQTTIIFHRLSTAHAMKASA